MSVVHDPRRAPLTCDPVPVCPACGGLECLCRPRFFAGQLLTDEDLNRLDSYIRGKNRLHNRMLHGWGTVNGLEVSCTPCGNTVTVSSGYALSPAARTSSSATMRSCRFAISSMPAVSASRWTAAPMPGGTTIVATPSKSGCWPSATTKPPPGASPPYEAPAPLHPAPIAMAVAQVIVAARSRPTREHRTEEIARRERRSRNASRRQSAKDTGFGSTAPRARSNSPSATGGQWRASMGLWHSATGHASRRFRS